MSKEYEYKILARMGSNKGTSLYIIVGTSERDARNKFKSRFLDGHIVSCVRGCEVTKPMQNKKKDDSSSNYGLALGIAGAVGGFLASKFLGGKDK